MIRLLDAGLDEPGPLERLGQIALLQPALDQPRG